VSTLRGRRPGPDRTGHQVPGPIFAATGGYGGQAPHGQVSPINLYNPDVPAALPLVVLVGRPNVGKSTLFNRITGSRRAIVTPVPGTTRDVIAQTVDWEQTPFKLLDTGGMFGATEDPLHQMVAEKGASAVKEADLLLMVLDGQQGVVSGDRDIVSRLRASGTPIIAVVNKIDARKAQAAAMEFFELGLDPIFEVSAEHGVGISDLLEEVERRLRKGPVREETATAPPKEVPRETAIAIIGRPNAGKSSLVNRLLREERMLVSEVPGTTRDAVDTLIKWHKRDFRIVDTAGIRRPGRVGRSGPLESLSVLVARRAIEKADVVVLVIDAAQGATDQDAAIAGEADRLGCGIIIAANKWDLMKVHGPDFYKDFDEKLRRQLKFLDYAPVMHISALTGERTPKLLEVVDKVAAARMRRVPTPEVNRFVRDVTAAHPPASPGRRQVRILYAAQTGVAPPTFVFFTNVATSFHFSYERFLLNQLRERFGFVGTPIRLEVRRRARKSN
jgi:GTP-binding protein